MGNSVSSIPHNLPIKKLERFTLFTKIIRNVAFSRSRVKLSYEKTNARSDIIMDITVEKSIEKKAFNNGLSIAPAFPVKKKGYSSKCILTEDPKFSFIPSLKTLNACGLFTISGRAFEYTRVFLKLFSARSALTL